MNDFLEKIKYIFNIILFYIIRFSLVFLAIYLSFLLINNKIKPNVTDELCLTNPQNCSEVEIYRFENTFIAKEKISQLWYWFNGINLYVYGQAVASCESDREIQYEPATVFSMNYDDNGDISFTQFPNECIPTSDYIVNNYRTIKGAKRENILLYRKDPTEVNSIYNVIKNMLDNKIFVLPIKNN